MQAHILQLLAPFEQWGEISYVKDSAYSTITFPISFSSSQYSVVANDCASSGNSLLFSIIKWTNSTCTVYGKRPNDLNTVGNYGRWIAIGH